LAFYPFFQKHATFQHVHNRCRLTAFGATFFSQAVPQQGTLTSQFHYHRGVEVDLATHNTGETISPSRNNKKKKHPKTKRKEDKNKWVS
jgi:hypothetical protein